MNWAAFLQESRPLEPLTFTGQDPSVVTYSLSMEGFPESYQA